MASKRFPAKRAKKKALPSIGRPPTADKPLSGAHPRLIHGFLVRLAVKAAARPGTAKAAPAARASAQARRSFPVDARQEGPADDSTFH